MANTSIQQSSNQTIALRDSLKAVVKPEKVSSDLTNSVSEVRNYIDKIIIWFFESIPSIIKAVLGLIIGLFLIRLLIKLIKRRFEARNVDISLRGFLMSVIKVILYGVLFLTVVKNLGFETSAILGALSGMVLAIGLALQGSLSNFAGGILILLFRPFEVGDYIENNSGTDGTVERIDLLYTTLVNAQGIKVFSPNGALANSVIKNFTKISSRRFDYNIGIAYESDIKLAKNTILEILNNDSRVIKKPAPEIFVSELADSAIKLTIRAWTNTDEYWAARNSLQEEIKIALDKAKIQIPFPQQEMRIIQPEKKEINETDKKNAEN